MVITRRHLLKAGAAAAVGRFPAPLHPQRACSIRQDRRRNGGGVARRHVLQEARRRVHQGLQVEVEFISIPHDNIRQQFVLDALSGAGGFDVYIADQVWLPEFYQKGFIKDLSPHVTDADRNDSAKRRIETVSYQGALVALPIMVHNCAMYYRTDLFEKAGLQGASGELGRVSRLREEDDRYVGRRLGHADRQQAGHRGFDPAARVLPASGRRPARRPTASRPSTQMPGAPRSNS